MRMTFAVNPIQNKSQNLSNGILKIYKHHIVMCVFMQPNESQMGIINDEKSDLQVHHRDGCGFNNEVSNLEIVTPQQNTKMALGNSVTALYAASNNLYMQFETQKDACAYFGISLSIFLSYLNNKEKQIEKNGQFFILIKLNK